jgi:hypothetical protein
VAAALSCVLGALGAGDARAQVLYGSVVGVVKDAQGASIPGATVAATNTATGLTRDTVTGEDGGYNLANVLPGPTTSRCRCRASGSSSRPACR